MVNCDDERVFRPFITALSPSFKKFLHLFLLLLLLFNFVVVSLFACKYKKRINCILVVSQT